MRCGRLWRKASSVKAARLVLAASSPRIPPARTNVAASTFTDAVPIRHAHLRLHLAWRRGVPARGAPRPHIALGDPADLAIAVVQKVDGLGALSAPQDDGVAKKVGGWVDLNGRRCVASQRLVSSVGGADALCAPERCTGVNSDRTKCANQVLTMFAVAGGALTPSNTLIPRAPPAFMNAAWPNVFGKIDETGAFDSFKGKGREIGPNHVSRCASREVTRLWLTSVSAHSAW